FVERGDRAQTRGRLVERDGIGRPHLSHDRQLGRIERSREIGTDRRPCGAAIVAAVDAVAAEIERARGVRADDERRIPMPAAEILTAAAARLSGTAATLWLIAAARGLVAAAARRLFAAIAARGARLRFDIRLLHVEHRRRPGTDVH